jgi:hypothetical protein
MATPQDWRELQEHFWDILRRDHKNTLLCAQFVKRWADISEHGVFRGWYITDGDDQARVQFRALASAGAVMLGYSRRDDRSGWADWLDSLRAEPLVSERVRQFPAGDEDDILIENVCYASGQYCQFLAMGATEPNVINREAMPDAMTRVHENKRRMDEYVKEVSKQRGATFTKKEIWTSAGYANPTEFNRWQQGRGSPTADQKFGRILREKPHLRRK